MAYQYCTATNYGTGFITHVESNKMEFRGYPGDVWVVDGGPNGDAWITKVSGVAKSKAEAQTIVDAAVAEQQAAWDALSAEIQAGTSGRPESHVLPGLG